MPGPALLTIDHQPITNGCILVLCGTLDLVTAATLRIPATGS
ncbi:MAG TPA: hypothetical protein VIK04_21155 [Solirubrobacteraceae bacterium]